MQQQQSVLQQIRTRVINKTVGQWMRAVDFVLSEYQPQGYSVEDESDHVTKLAILMMLTRWYDEEDICLLLDSTALKLPKKLAESSRYQISKILDRTPPGAYEIADFGPKDDDAPPGEDGPSEALLPLPEDA